MANLRQVLGVGVLCSVISLYSAQAEDCSLYRDVLKEYQDTSATLDREQTSYKSMASNSRDQQRHAVCRALKNNVSALIGMQTYASPGCLADPSRYQEGVDAMASELDDLTKQEALMCNPGE